jgi:hypothetical protein
VKIRNLKHEPIGYLPPVVEETDLAVHLGITPRSMRSLRKSGRGPVYVQAGRNFVYLKDAVLTWLETGNAEVEGE